MPNWSESMEQTFEYYIVNPITWMDQKKLDHVKSCSITRDSSKETLYSATFDVDEELGECYIRVYLITTQNRLIEKFPLGTFLVQTPSTTFNGIHSEVSLDAYSPLMELSGDLPPIGYALNTDTNILQMGYQLTKENVRAPVVETKSDITLHMPFVAEVSEGWLSYLTALLKNADHAYDVDEMGRILFAPNQEVASLQPVWTYNDDNSSILLPSLTVDRDLYSVPNVVQVLYSKAGDHLYAEVVNDDKNSPISIQSRGRRIVQRIVDPDLIGVPDQALIEAYAKRALKALSSVECSISYEHGYCPVRLGDCIRLNYLRAGFENVRAKVVSQNIKCETGCLVTEKAVFTTALWG